MKKEKGKNSEIHVKNENELWRLRSDTNTFKN